MNSSWAAARLRGAWSLRAPLALGAAALLSAIAFAEIADEIVEGPSGSLRWIDERVLGAFIRLRSPWLNDLAVEFTALGSATLIMTVTLIAVTVLWLARLRGRAVQLLLAASGAGITMLMTKWVFARPRPEPLHRVIAESGFSFPSGHSLEAAAVYFTLALLACRHFRAAGARFVLLMFAVLISVGVAASRVYLGVHYPSDVSAGLCLGVAWALIVQALASWLGDRTDGQQSDDSVQQRDAAGADPPA